MKKLKNTYTKSVLIFLFNITQKITCLLASLSSSPDRLAGRQVSRFLLGRMGKKSLSAIKNCLFRLLFHSRKREVNFLLLLSLLLLNSCQRDIEDLEPATYPVVGEVFIDEFSSGLNFAAFGGSKVTAFDVDTDETYAGEAAMKFAVPDAGDPEGGFAGGVFFTEVGRDLSGYDALTFWAKASKAASVDIIGFGNDLGESKYQATLNGVKLNTNWQKIIIPIPDPSKLTQERGMLYFVEAPENESGYTFWLDEVQFEKLGTLAHPQPIILDGQDQTVTSETGAKLRIGGLFASFNLPTGVDQKVEAAPSYFTFSSSASSVATVSNSGEAMVLDAGTAIITAKLGDQDAKGSLTIESTGDPVLPASPAPTPTVPADSVISMFSNAYTNVLVDTWNTGWEFSTAETTDVKVDGDDIKKYTNLNFVGIEFSAQTIDASEMTHFHMDIWTPDPTDLPAVFKILLVDFGADGNFDGGDDSSHEITFTSPTLTTESWISLDIPFTSLPGLTNRGHLAQLVLSGDLPNVFVDNVYFYKGSEGSTGAEPTEAAPTPTREAGEVISIFSDAYTNVDGSDLNPDWGQATVVSEVSIQDNNTLLYAGLNYQGLQLGSNLDISAMTHLHLDFWTDNSTALNVFLISPGPVEKPYTLTVPTDGWASIDIPLSSFDPVDVADLIQFKFDGNGNIYLDNIYFYKDDGGGGDMPTEAAPTPMQAEADVISVFSDSYMNIAGTDLNPDWGQATVVSEVSIEGNNTLQYAGLNYQGIQLGSSQDVSGMTHLHLDIWSANSTALNAFLISTGPVEKAYALTVPTSGWASVDIPLSEFSPVELMDIIQFKFDGNGDVYLDNIFFYKEGSGGGDMPTEAAPTPMQAEADVISVFSDSYMNIAGTDLNPDWGQATVVSEVSIEGNNTLQYAGLNYQGIQLGSSQDVSGMTHLHLDIWSANSTALNAFLISTGPVEKAYALTVPTSGWTSVDIPLSEFSPVELMDIIQFKFDGNGDVYLDNIFFYKEGSGGGDMPTEAAPTPMQAEADVISVFSDSYMNIAGTDLNPDWGQATVVSEVSIEGNNTLQYAGLNYQGIQLGSSQDVSGMTHLHLDIWTANSTALNAFLISTGPVEKAYALTVPTSGWTSVDIPLSEFSPVELMDIIQFKFDGNGDIYLDNIYFYK